MKKLLHVSYGGDYTGTKLVLELKKWCSQTFNSSVCNEDQPKKIFAQIQNKCKELAEANPRCKKPEVRFDDYNIRGWTDCGTAYHIELADGNGMNNTALLNFGYIKHFYGDIENYVNEC